MSLDRKTAFGLAFVLALAAAGASAIAASSSTTPPNPYIDKGACPFECCTYRDWKTTKPIALLDKPYGKKTVASVSAGQIVHGITGTVYSVPVRTVASRSFEAESSNSRHASIKRGDVYYALHYLGEGDWLIWFKGETYEAEPEPVGMTVEGPPSDDTQWWVNVRTLSGKSGWVLETDQFDNQDACG